MIEQRQNGISRRDFIKLALCIGGSALVGMKIDWATEKGELIGLPEEEAKMLSEITSFRESLGLEGLPDEIQPVLRKQEQWSGSPADYVDALPEKNKSYSMRTFEVIQIVFGNNATRIVKGSKPHPQHPYGMSFDGGSRFCNISDSAHSIPLEKEFTDYALHEACGYGSDPAVGASYPSEILVRVEHGKWRALSQAFSVPDQFLNHSRDLMLPMVKRSVGEMVGRFMVGDQKTSIVDDKNITEVRNEVDRIAREIGENSNDIKYNKAVCKEIGERLIALLRCGEIRFEGDLKEEYQQRMEAACREIYAEMFKYGLLYQDKIQYNSDVISGITEVISAIADNSNMSDIAESISKPSDEILKRNKAEKIMLSSTSPETSIAPTLSPEEQERAKKQQEVTEKNERSFQLFSKAKGLPMNLEISGDQRDIAQHFSTIYSRVINKYPALKETSTQRYNESFDPQMHIWEIREIEEAMDSGFVRSLSESPSISDEMIKDMKKRIEVLENFVASPAF